MVTQQDIERVRKYHYLSDKIGILKEVLKIITCAAISVKSRNSSTNIVLYDESIVLAVKEAVTIKIEELNNELKNL